ncbi:formyltransferase family protein [Xenorhabdus szentirmaii]
MFTVMTDAFFHTSFLHEKLRGFQLNWIVRNSRKLDISLLDNIHRELSKKEKITNDDIIKLEEIYQGLNETEKYLAKAHGVPETHSLSSATMIETGNFGESFYQDYLNHECSQDKDGALIFMTVILSPFWIEHFEKRIVNAHSAILPYARGMFAIEQLATAENKEAIERSAGATIHYVDPGIDTGPIIEQKRLPSPWALDSIWGVKGESQLTAFGLLKSYLERENKFQFTDTLPIKQDIKSPLFMSKTFTDEVKRKAEASFLKMKEM